MNRQSNPSSKTQHFYLRLAREHAVCPSDHKTHPVGIIAFRKTEDGKLRVAGSMVSKKDMFLKKAAIGIVTGRLNSKAACEYTPGSLSLSSAEEVAADVGLYTEKANYFNEVDWTEADKTLRTALDIYNKRLAEDSQLSPVSA